MTIRFILASQSPRRRQLLQLLGYPFTTMPAAADEDSITHPDPALNVVQTAQLKTAVIRPNLPQPAANERVIVIAADTTVALDNTMLNKPADATAARTMLTALRDRTHYVHTGISLLDVGSGREVHGVNTAAVVMRPYSDAEIDAYIATGDPFDKAGGYAVQHPTFQPAARIDGCYTGVMGLSLCHLLTLLDALDVPRQFDAAGLHAAHSGYPCPILPVSP